MAVSPRASRMDHRHLFWMLWAECLCVRNILPTTYKTGAFGMGIYLNTFNNTLIIWLFHLDSCCFLDSSFIKKAENAQWCYLSFMYFFFFKNTQNKFYKWKDKNYKIIKAMTHEANQNYLAPMCAKIHCIFLCFIWTYQNYIFNDFMCTSRGI